jgi:hypothetical protein
MVLHSLQFSNEVFKKVASKRLSVFVHAEHWRVITRLIEFIDIKKCSVMKFTF